MWLPRHFLLDATFVQQGRVAGMLAQPRPALPRGKMGCPAPQKLTKPAGRNGAKLTVDCTDYAHTFGLRMEKKMK